MKTTLKIMKNELQMLFCSPIAWIVLVIFMFHCGSTFCESIEPNLKWKAQGYDLEVLTNDLFVGFRGLFSVMLKKIFIYFPLLTMGVLSKEYSGGSISLLYSSPISNRKIVWGKYLALVVFSLTFIAIFVLFIIYSSIIVPHLDLGMLLAGLLGFFLLCCAYSAIGLFMSSLTSYQVVAAIGTFAVLAVLNSIGDVGQEYPLVREITYWFSINGRSYNFVRGLICSEDVIYFIVIIAMFLSLTLAKLHFDRTKKNAFAKVLRYVSVVAVACVIGYVSSRPKLMSYVDMTDTKSNTLTAASQEILSKLDGPMTITTYVNLLDKNFIYALPRSFKNDTKIFTNYRRFKPEIKLDYVYYYHDCNNPEMDQRFPNTPDVNERAKVVAKGFRLKLESFLTPSEIDSLIDLSGEEYYLTRGVKYNGKISFVRMFEDMQRYPSEAEISAAMSRLTGEQPPIIAFSAANGERNIYSQADRDYYTFGRNVTMRSALVNQGFDTQNLDLSTLDSIPSNVLALVLADPQTAYSEHDLAVIKDYINKGGNAVIAASENSRDFLNPVLAELGLVFSEGLVVKEDEQHSPELLVCDVHPAAGNITGTYNFLRSRGYKFASPRTVPIAQFDNKGYQFIPVFNTDSTGCWIEKTTTDFVDDYPVFEPEKGDEAWNDQPLMVGAVKQFGDKIQKISVLSNAECISNGEIGMNRKDIPAANFYLILESARWFSNGQYPVPVNRPHGKDNIIKIDFDQLPMHKAVFIWILPILLAALGAWICIKRQRQ